MTDILDKDPTKLSEEELKKYNKAKSEKLKQKVKTKQFEVSTKEKEALDNIIEGSKKETIMDIDLWGEKVKVSADTDKDYIKKANKLGKYKNMVEDEITEEKYDEIKNELIEILSKMLVDYEKDYLKKRFKGVSLGKLITIIDGIGKKIQKKRKY